MELSAGGKDEEKVIRELLLLDPEARAVVSSGYSNDRVMAEYLEHGCKAMLVKPYQLEDLDKVIRKVLQPGAPLFPAMERL
jgi:DNA-binding NarL/FixJ family response regulator